MAFSSATLFVPFLVFSLTSASEDQREIKAKPGDDVTLQCQSRRDADITLLEWIRPDLKTDGYVFFYRNERSYERYQHPSFLGRAQLRDPEMKDGDVSVILKNVTVNDTGTYECRIIIGNTEGRERDPIKIKHIVQLTVTESALAAGNTEADGGDEDEGKKDEGKKLGYGGILLAASVLGVVLLFLLLGIVYSLILKKRKESIQQNSYRQPYEKESMSVQM